MCSYCMNRSCNDIAVSRVPGETQVIFQSCRLDHMIALFSWTGNRSFLAFFALLFIWLMVVDRIVGAIHPS